MDKMWKFMKKIFCLPPIATIIIAVPSFAFVIYVLACGLENQVFSYIVYILSAYSLIITITGITGIVKWVRGGIKEHPLVRKMLSIPIVGRLVNEKLFRTEAALYPGFLFNMLYVAFKLGAGIFYKSAWFISLAVYYLALAMMRFSLIHYTRHRGDKADIAEELRRYRMCGGLLLLLNAAFAGMTVMVVKKNMGFVYPGMMIYVMAAYTFYSITIAIINLIKYRKYGSPVISAAKVISLTTALVSMFSLETAMLTQFGGADDIFFRKLMTSLTGGAVSVFVVAMAAYMLINSTRRLKR